MRRASQILNIPARKHHSRGRSPKIWDNDMLNLEIFNGYQPRLFCIQNSICSRAYQNTNVFPRNKGYHSFLYLYIQKSATYNDCEESFSGQNCFPAQLPRQIFYTPRQRGYEREIEKRLAWWNSPGKDR